MQANNSIKLSVKQILSEPWTLMKGKKLYFFLTNLPFLALLLFFILKTWRLWPDLVKAVLAGNTAATLNYIANLSNYDMDILFIFFTASSLSISYIICNNIILGCDIAKDENFQFHPSHLIKATKRIGPFYVSSIICGIIGLPIQIPFIGWGIYFLIVPACTLYILLVIYHKGPFKSVKKTFIVMKNNFWRIFLVYWLTYLIALVLSLTIIGLIWAIPFCSLVYGIINRELIEKKTESKSQVNEENSANLAMANKNRITE